MSEIQSMSPCNDFVSTAIYRSLWFVANVASNRRRTTIANKFIKYLEGLTAVGNSKLREEDRILANLLALRYPNFEEAAALLIVEWEKNAVISPKENDSNDEPTNDQT